MEHPEWVDKGYGLQDSYGNSVDSLRSNLRLTPEQRLKRADSSLRGAARLRTAGRKAGLIREERKPYERIGDAVDVNRLLAILEEAGADFVVIGGVAMILHGSDHLTVDADVAIIRRRENARVIAAALAPFHPKPRFWPEGLPFSWGEETIMRSTTLTLMTDLGALDLLAEPDGCPPYTVLKQRSVQVEIADGITVSVAGFEDLISMKRAAGRPKDIAHIAELETIRRINGESGSP